MTQTRKQRLRTHFPVLSLFLFSKIKNKNLALQLDRYVPLRVDGQAHLADVLLVKLLPLGGRHGDAGSVEGVVEHLVDVQVDGPAQGLVQSLEEGAAADLLGVAGVEIVDEAVEDKTKEILTV